MVAFLKTTALLTCALVAMAAAGAVGAPLEPWQLDDSCVNPTAGDAPVQLKAAFSGDPRLADLRLAPSTSNVFDASWASRRCPQGYRWATVAEVQGLLDESAPCSGSSNTYYGQCGWNMYTYAGVTRKYFITKDLAEGGDPNQAIIHAGQSAGDCRLFDGLVDVTISNGTVEMAGLICMAGEAAPEFVGGLSAAFRNSSTAVVSATFSRPASLQCAAYAAGTEEPAAAAVLAAEPGEAGVLSRATSAAPAAVNATITLVGLGPVAGGAGALDELVQIYCVGRTSDAERNQTGVEATTAVRPVVLSSAPEEFLLTPQKPGQFELWPSVEVPSGQSLSCLVTVQCAEAGACDELGVTPSLEVWSAGERDARVFSVEWAPEGVAGAAGGHGSLGFSCQTSAGSSTTYEGPPGVPFRMVTYAVDIQYGAGTDGEWVVMPEAESSVRASLNVASLPGGSSVTLTPVIAAHKNGSRVTARPGSVTWSADDPAGTTREMNFTWDAVARGSSATVTWELSGPASGAYYVPPSGELRLVLGHGTATVSLPAELALRKPSAEEAVQFWPPLPQAGPGGAAQARPWTLATGSGGSSPFVERTGDGRLRWTGPLNETARSVTVAVEVDTGSIARPYEVFGNTSGTVRVLSGLVASSPSGSVLESVTERSVLELELHLPDGTSSDDVEVALGAALGADGEALSALASAGAALNVSEWGSGAAEALAEGGTGLFVRCGNLSLGGGRVIVSPGDLYSQSATCTPPLGLLGEGWVPVLLTKVDGTPCVPTGANVSRVRAPAPEPVRRSVRVEGTPAERSVGEATVRNGGSERIEFELRHAGMFPNLVKVTYGGRYECGDVELAEGPAAAQGTWTVSCAVDPEGTGTSLPLAVTVASVEGTSTTELVSYEVAPAVSDLGGCASNDTCWTAGGGELVVRGFDFGADKNALTVRVGGKVCVVQAFRPAAGAGQEATLWCAVPLGSGTGLGVTVERRSGRGTLLESDPAEATVSYAQPKILSLRSADCADTRSSGGRSVQLERCPRGRGLSLTVEGRHFGLQGVTVSVGGSACANLRVMAKPDAASPDTQVITCDVQPAVGGAGPGTLSVLVLQRGGSFSTSLSGESTPRLSYELCSAGSRQANGSCVPCGRNTYQIAAGQAVCLGCPAGQYAKGGDRAKYTCHDCPAGADCTPTCPAQAREGYWLFEESDSGRVRSVRCETGRCLAPEPACQDGTQPGGSPFENDRRYTSAVSSRCAVGRVDASQNPMCGQCVPGKSEWGGECVACAEASLWRVLGFVALGFAALAALEFLTRRSSGATVKITVGFAQTLYAFFAATEDNEVSAIRGGALFSFNALDLSSACVVPMSDLTKAVAPVVQVLFMLLFLLVLLAGNAGTWYVRRCCGSLPRSAGFKRSRFIRVLVALMLFAYIPTLRVAVRLLQCEEVDGVRLLRQYPSVECAGGAYTAWLVFAWLVAAALLVGGCLFVALYGQRQYRAYARRDEPPVLAQAERQRLEKVIGERFGFLFRSYRARRPAGEPAHLEAVTASWEAVVLARSTALVLVATLVEDWQSRFALLALVSSALFQVHAKVRPYRAEAENTLEACALSTYAVVGFLNSTAWHASAAGTALSATLFYGFLAAAVAWAAVRAWTSDSVQTIVSKVRSSTSASRAPRAASSSSLSSSSMSSSSSSPSFSKARGGRSCAGRAAAAVARLFCWYHPISSRSARAAPAAAEPAVELHGADAGAGGEGATPPGAGDENEVVVVEAPTTSEQEDAPSAAASARRSRGAGSSFVCDGVEWQKTLDTHGTPYYYCPATRESQWERPVSADGGSKREA